MRIIAGSARGCKLYAPRGVEVRPTADRIKEAMFSSIHSRLEGSRFLDLFSGTGAIGIEALSRGAAGAVLVDKSPVCTGIINKNLIFTKLNERAEIITDTALSAIKKLSGKEPFDFIFLDPPYNQNLITPALEAVVNQKIIKESGLVIAEYGNMEEIICPQGLNIVKRSSYRISSMICYEVVE